MKFTIQFTMKNIKIFENMNLNFLSKFRNQKNFSYKRHFITFRLKMTVLILKFRNLVLKLKKIQFRIQFFKFNFL